MKAKNRNHILYEYLVQTLAMQVDIGYLQFGEPLPTQQQLSRQFNVSINTVRTALQHLEKRGYLHSRPVSYTHLDVYKRQS